MDVHDNSSSLSPSHKPKISWPAIAFAVTAAVGIVSLMVWHEIKSEPQPPTGEKPVLSVEETIRLDALKWEAIGLLENGNYAEAEAKFRLVALALPDDEVVLRNVAIGRLLRLDKDKSDEAFEEAEVAVNQLLQAQPQSPTGFWLLAKRLDAYRAKISSEGATDEDLNAALVSQLMALERCCDLQSHSATFWYARSVTQKGDESDERQVRQAHRSLRKALVLAPENIFLLIKTLQSMAANEDADFADTADALAKAIRPLAGGLSRKVPVDLFQVLEEAKGFTANGQWAKAGRRLTPLIAVLNDDIAQADRRQVDPHLLEFVVREFTSAAPAPMSLDAQTLPPLDFKTTALTLTGPPVGSLQHVAWGDADLDEQLDLWVLAKSAADDGACRLGVYERGESPGEWREFCGIDVPAGMSGFRLSDLDRDDKGLKAFRPGRRPPGGKDKIAQADLDAVVFGPGGVRILRCEVADDGARTFTVVPQPAGLDDLRDVRTLVLGDLEQDGDVDLCLAIGGSLQLWINRGTGVFDSATEWSITPPAGVEFTGLAAVDLDRDVDLDIVAVGPGLDRAGVLENHRHLNFRWRDFDDLPRDSAGFAAVRVFEADGNASWDLALAGANGVHLALSDTPRAGTINLRSTNLLTDGQTNDLLCGDFDNDGCQDLVTSAADEPQLLRGLPSGAFAPGVRLAGADEAPWRGAAAADFDRDGDLDLIALTARGLSLLDNQPARPTAWLDVEVRGSEEELSGRVNYLAIGSVVEMRGASGRYQAQVVQGPLTHFGLGPDPKAGLARVIFTNGIPQSVVNPEPRQTVREVQKNIGSCPYCYVWNGREFEFYTDLLWAAPLGLLTAEGKIMPDRSWEYLKVDGERLVARDGHYEMLLTEELWEAGYFDQVELLAVDHPADVEVYSNEKVGPPDLAKFQIHTVKERRTPVAALDSAGRDMLPALRERDNRFATCFQKSFRQGLVETHHLELDLGRLEAPRRILLYLTGWIRPTDTSLNLAIEQNPELQAPRPPRILAPGADGQWREVSAFMGFPGGKPKTIVVDLTGLLTDPHYRLRIETSHEIRWDEAFFTVDEEPAEFRLQPLELASAELRYGGFSKRLEPAEGAPEWFDRKEVELAPQWPPMRGAFTRFGDVRELLTATDDRLAILGAGDEIHVRFKAPPPPPAGWKRDFILHNVGWDKDCVLNTVFGQTVEPLPFQAMKSYPYATEEYPNTPELREYLRKYQTRRQDFLGFWRLLQAPARN